MEAGAVLAGKDATRHHEEATNGPPTAFWEASESLKELPKEPKIRPTSWISNAKNQISQMLNPNIQIQDPKLDNLLTQIQTSKPEKLKS